MCQVRVLGHFCTFSSFCVSIYTLAGSYTLRCGKKVDVVAKLKEERDWFPRLDLSAITFSNINNDITAEGSRPAIKGYGRANFRSSVLIRHM